MENTRIQWHPAFFAAVNLELVESRSSLEFYREYNLNVKPLEIDMLVTKKHPDTTVGNEIGRIFRGHNIIEYKDPADGLNIDVFFKTEGCACLYKSYGKTVDAIKEEDITVTFIRDTRPNGLFRYFGEHGYGISSPYNGIYYITGRIPFPAQIVVSKELHPKSHVWLRALSEKLEKKDIQNLMQHIRQLKGKQDREYADAVLEVALKANMKIIAELIGDDRMSEELLELIRPVIEPRLLLIEQDALNKGIEQGIIKGAVDILRDFGHGSDEIKTIIMKKYELSEKDADKYL